MGGEILFADDVTQYARFGCCFTRFTTTAAHKRDVFLLSSRETPAEALRTIAAEYGTDARHARLWVRRPDKAQVTRGTQPGSTAVVAPLATSQDAAGGDAGEANSLSAQELEAERWVRVDNRAASLQAVCQQMLLREMLLGEDAKEGGRNMGSLAEGRADLVLGLEVLSPKGTWVRDLLSMEEHGGDDSWRKWLQVGDPIDAKDCDGKWFEAEIAEIPDSSMPMLRIHYRGWLHKWNQDVERWSGDLAPYHTNVPNWRDFRVNDRIEVPCVLSASVCVCVARA